MIEHDPAAEPPITSGGDPVCGDPVCGDPVC
ncbi:hypothetical protein KEK_11588 [Mycolicibacterium thermoresistibile ATCC 19527]|uniref:Uncharacterized protein n=1 Tax=Mycolicibacterium thermoresistibile (strain ATCC 19527 / DSM 44167 / CIP 105390 / JCM 6362 / NCTC 10409 / 316) TaxID=1078020 RepID=G7CJL5_MYCT3|nr:hypothetical protein KEK_11588 [Mycolicibacterium thermoresistibile ATCC 19527]